MATNKPLFDRILGVAKPIGKRAVDVGRGATEWVDEHAEGFVARATDELDRLGHEAETKLGPKVADASIRVAEATNRAAERAAPILAEAGGQMVDAATKLGQILGDAITRAGAEAPVDKPVEAEIVDDDVEP